MKDKELIEKSMELEKQLDLAGHRHYADTILRLVERVEELQPEPESIVWEPKKGEEYWYVGCDGTVQFTDWRADKLDMDFLEHHNVYKTQGQAEKAAKYQRRYNMVLQAVLNLEPDQVVDWKDKNQAKYVVSFDHIDGVWFFSERCVVDNLSAPLTNKENVQPLLDYLNAKEKSE
mgnify:CR=1 FL=1